MASRSTCWDAARRAEAAADLILSGGNHENEEGHGIGLGAADMILIGQVMSRGGTVPKAAARIGPRLLAKARGSELITHNRVVAIGWRGGSAMGAGPRARK